MKEAKIFKRKVEGEWSKIQFPQRKFRDIADRHRSFPHPSWSPFLREWFRTGNRWRDWAWDTPHFWRAVQWTRPPGRVSLPDSRETPWVFDTSLLFRWFSGLRVRVGRHCVRTWTRSLQKIAWESTSWGTENNQWNSCTWTFPSDTQTPFPFESSRS